MILVGFWGAWKVRPSGGIPGRTLDRRSKTYSCAAGIFEFRKGEYGRDQRRCLGCHQCCISPELVGKVVADSFDGRALADDFSENLIQERISARENERAVEVIERFLEQR